MFGEQRDQSDFDSEIQSHLEIEEARLREQGLSAEDARDAARRHFGNVTRAHEQFYEKSRWMWLNHLRQDLR